MGQGGPFCLRSCMLTGIPDLQPRLPNLPASGMCRGEHQAREVQVFQAEANPCHFLMLAVGLIYNPHPRPKLWG